MSAGEASHTETIAGTPQQCFDAITDYATFPEWQKPVVACEVLDSDSQGRGTIVKTTLDVKVRKIRYTLHYHYEEPEQIWWDYVEGDAKDIGGGYVFEDNGDGTTTATYTVSIDVPMWIPGQIRRFLETQAISASVKELKRRVEGVLALAARNVLYVHSSAGRYGADNQLELIARGLDRECYRPIVALPFEDVLAERLRDAGAEVLVRPLAVLRRAGMSPAGLVRTAAAVRADGRALGRLVRDRDVALVHSNTSVVLGGRAAAHAARVAHVWHVREIYAGTAYVRVWPAWRRVVGAADAVVCVSEATARQFAPRSPNVRVVRDGVKLADAPAEDQRERFGIPDGALAVAMLGRLSDWKGQSALIRALAAEPLSGEGAAPAVTALIAGSAWPGEEQHAHGLRELAVELGAADRVRFLGEVADPEALYAAADVVAVPSLRPDPFPNTALEAALAGRPVVATRTGGLPEIVLDGQTGLLVAPGDARALAAALAELGADPALRARMGQAARERAAREFTPERMVAEVQAVYDEVLSARRGQ